MSPTPPFPRPGRQSAWFCRPGPTSPRPSSTRLETKARAPKPTAVRLAPAPGADLPRAGAGAARSRTQLSAFPRPFLPPGSPRHRLPSPSTLHRCCSREEPASGAHSFFIRSNPAASPLSPHARRHLQTSPAPGTLRPAAAFRSRAGLGGRAAIYCPLIAPRTRLAHKAFHTQQWGFSQQLTRNNIIKPFTKTSLFTIN